MLTIIHMINDNLHNTFKCLLNNLVLHKQKMLVMLRNALGTLRPQDTSTLNYSAEVSGHFGTDLYETLRHHFGTDFVLFVAG